MLDFHLVAFIDILGYSQMVKSDLEGPRGEEKYFKNLLELHKNTSAIKYDNLDFSIIQFSDSVIISTPYDLSKFLSFSKLISDYQYNLFKSGILVRGGVTFGKHYYKDDFLFSGALIDAYQIETKLAKFPRIIISQDLMDLVLGQDALLQYLLKDNNYWIIDYLHDKEPSEDETTEFNKLIGALSNNRIDTISEKGLWLKEYFFYKLGGNISDYKRFEK